MARRKRFKRRGRKSKSRAPFSKYQTGSRVKRGSRKSKVRRSYQPARGGVRL